MKEEKNNNIWELAPKTLENAEKSYYESEAFFNEKIFKKVKCYYHSTFLGWLFPINMHSHEFYEINVVLSGQGIHYFNNERISINIGDVFIINPKSKHGYYAFGDMEIYHILLSKSFFKKYYDELNNMEGYVSLFNIEPKLRSEKINNSFLRLNKTQFNTILADINRLAQHDKGSKYDNNIQTSIVFEIICKFCEYYNTQNIDNKNNKNSYTQAIIYAMEYMKLNLSQKLSIDDIAKEVFMSRSSFIRYFTQTTNASPIQYLNGLRISYSKKLLRETDLSITNIAQKCGFFDSSYFEKQFIKSESVTPSTYRKMNKNS